MSEPELTAPSQASEAASTLGKLAAGKKKNLSPERRAQLSERMAKFNKARSTEGKRVVKRVPPPVISEGHRVVKTPPQRPARAITTTIWNG